MGNLVSLFLGSRLRVVCKLPALFSQFVSVVGFRVRGLGFRV